MELLYRKEYFQLDRELGLFKDSISEVQQLYFQAHADNAFNRNEKALEHINILINYHAGDLPDSLKAALCELKQDSYFKFFQYAKAAQCDSILLGDYLHVIIVR
jgi:hypothetical protein